MYSVKILRKYSLMMVQGCW